MEVEVAGSLVKIQFNSNVLPVFKEVKNKDYVYFGENNNYPAFLLELYRKHAAHNAIIKAKSKYIYGKGLGISPDTQTIQLAKGQAYLSRANRHEDWNSVYEKTVKSIETFNGFVWQIIWEIGGKRCDVYCMQLAKFRRSVCGTKVFYCNKWTDDKTGRPLAQTELDKNGFAVFDAFDPDVRKGTQIYYYQVPEQCTDEYGDVYPTPEYVGCIINLASDIAIREFQYNLVSNGMTAHGMLSLFNGEPTPEEKKKIARLFESKYTGPGKAGQIIFNFVDRGTDSKGAEYTPFNPGDLDKQFELFLKTNQDDVFTGHNVTNKSLFGIATEGALSDRTAIDLSFEQMTNTYTEPRQNLILGEIRMIAGLCGENLMNLEVKPLAPLGVNLTDPNISKYFTEDEIRESLGYKPKEKPQGQVDPNAPQVNEHLKNITGRQWINIKRLIREVQNGKTRRDVASLLLKNSYGLSDEDINTLLPMQPGLFKTAFQFAEAVYDTTAIVLQMFEELSEPENPLDEIIGEEFMGEPTVESKILDILKGDPTTPQSKIARMLGIEADLVKTTIDNLLEKGQVEISAGRISVTDKGDNRKVPPVETEIYTVYKYVTREGVPRAKETRPFCKRLLELTADGKVWSREAIENISNELGEPAWSYRGGWYTNPDTGETTTHCRHVWKAITRSRTKKNG